MRAYAEVGGGKATFHIPRTSNRIAMTEVRDTDLADGWYRASATYQHMGRAYNGWWSLKLGKKVDPSKEAARLRKMAARLDGREAHTGSPGIAGYQHRAQNASGAIRVQEQVSNYFAELLELAAAGS